MDRSKFTDILMGVPFVGSKIKWGFNIVEKQMLMEIEKLSEEQWQVDINEF